MVIHSSSAPTKMKQFIALLGALAACLAAPSIGLRNPNGTVNYRPTIGGRIVGGIAANIEDLPWQVAILRHGVQSCGGILVAPKIVLTAAHCVAPSVIANVASLNIRSGSSLHYSGGSRVAASKITLHPLYQDCSNCSLDYDIAVVDLAANANIAPASTIGLWDESATFPAGMLATVSGWGATLNVEIGTEQLRRVDVPVVAEVQCRNIYGSIITTRTICAGMVLGGRDACQGDSGGPLVIQNRLAGIVSFGAGCAKAGWPGVYASIPGYRAWIRQNAGV